METLGDICFRTFSRRAGVILPKDWSKKNRDHIKIYVDYINDNYDAGSRIDSVMAISIADLILIHDLPDKDQPAARKAVLDMVKLWLDDDFATTNGSDEDKRQSVAAVMDHLIKMTTVQSQVAFGLAANATIH